jgi:hypothetical protein
MHSGLGIGGCGRLRALAAALLAAAALAAIAASGASAGAVRAAKLTPAEQVFVKQYKLLIPKLDRASAALVDAVNDASKLSDAQVTAVFTSVAKQWTSATRPLFALKAPPQVAAIFKSIRTEVPAVEADLLAAAHAGATHDGAAARSAGKKLALDFNRLGAAIAALKKALPVP